MSAAVMAWLLFLAPVPLIFRIFGGGAAALAGKLVALALLWLGVWLIREGLRARAAFDARVTASRPFPRIIPGSLLLGCGVAALVWPAGGVTSAAIYGMVAVVLALVAFGLDPLADKGAPDVSAGDRQRVIRAVAQAEALLSEMEEAAQATRDRELRDRVCAFADTARAMFRAIESDPRDLTRARRFMGVYLQGARDATVKYTRLVASRPDPTARTALRDLLEELESRFNDKREDLLADDRSDLDVEIEVLQDFLKREAV